ncbi:MAG: hypothetical protein U0840_05990 [Gemmataceae bacterium]
MRHMIWLLALGIGLVTVSQSHAQLLGFGSNNTSNTNRQSPSNQTGYVHPSNQLSSPFRLRNLFPSLSDPVRNRTPLGRSNIPDPSTPEYFKAFGYRKLY